MLEETGCDGVMIGRGAMGNPWLFRQISAALSGEAYDAPSLEERMETAKRHLAGMIAHKGDRVGLAEAKKHMAWYTAGVHGAASARSAIMNAQSPEEISLILSDLVKNENA